MGGRSRTGLVVAFGERTLAARPPPFTALPGRRNGAKRARRLILIRLFGGRARRPGLEGLPQICRNCHDFERFSRSASAASIAARAHKIADRCTDSRRRRIQQGASRSRTSNPDAQNRSRKRFRHSAMTIAHTNGAELNAPDCRGIGVRTWIGDNVRVFFAVARAGQFVVGGQASEARSRDGEPARRGARGRARRQALRPPHDGRETHRRRTSVSSARRKRWRAHSCTPKAKSPTSTSNSSGDVRIGAPDGFSTYYLAGALRDFVERHPSVRVQLLPLPQLTPLARREVDIVVGLDKPEAGRFVARKLTDYTLGIYASAGLISSVSARPPTSGRSAGPSPHRLRRGARLFERPRLCPRAL